jgi:NTP pyrophosphatase (non-canonical NTP hydrolase)
MEKLMDEKNIAKGGWGDITIHELNTMLIEEFCELLLEIGSEKLDYKSIRLEAADVANFAHMIIQRCDREIQDAKVPGA